MGWFSSALRYVADTFDQNGPRDVWNPRFWSADLGGVMSVAGVHVNERRVSQLGAIQAVRNGISGALSTLPVSVIRVAANGERTPMPDHPATLLLNRPSARMKRAELIGEISWHVAYFRNAYCVIHPGNDPAAPDYSAGELEVLHPRRLALVERRADGMVYYTFNPPATFVQGARLQPVTYREDQLWHIRANPLREDGLLGEPIWESAREVFGRAIAVHDYGNIWFANSGQSGGTLEHPGNFKDKVDRAEFLENWREAGTGRNRHKDRLLTHGVKYNPIKVTNAEAQLLETEDSSDTDIFGLFGFPPHLAARLKRSTNNNIEQQSLDFARGLAPIATAIEQAAERDFLIGQNDAGLVVEFNFWGLLRADLRARYAAYMIGRQGEWLSANDVRRLENMSPRTDPGGDEYKNPVTKSAPSDAGESNDSGAGGETDRQPGKQEGDDNEG